MLESDLFVLILALSGNLVYGTIAIAALTEVLSPCRAAKYSINVRWPSNFALGLINILLNHGLYALLGIGTAITVGQNGWGLLNIVSWSVSIEFVLTILLLDCIGYFLHRLFHAVPIFWRLHLVHHSDLDFDFSTAVRHHPFEALVSGLFFVLIVAVLGLPPLGVLVYVTCRGISSNFTHANLALPSAVDRVLRMFIITPDMHRIHHSALRKETDSNFGVVFPVWDRLFGTYCEQPMNGHQGMRIGLDFLENPSQIWLHRLLMQPFTKIS